MTITARELDSLLADVPEDQYDYGNVWKAFKYQEVEYPFVLADDIAVTRTVADFGGEGQGDDYWVVVEVQTPDGTQLFRKDGYYASYYGGELDGDTVEVAPVEVIVTEYRRK